MGSKIRSLSRILPQHLDTCVVSNATEETFWSGIRPGRNFLANDYCFSGSGQGSFTSSMLSASNVPSGVIRKVYRPDFT
jgi:hypothetical protein